MTRAPRVLLVAVALLLSACAHRPKHAGPTRGRIASTLPPGALYHDVSACVQSDRTPWEPSSCVLCEGQEAATIHEAALCFNLELARRLIEQDPSSVHRRDRSGRTPLVAALTSKSVYWARANDPRQLELARYLLSKGADPRVRFAYSGLQSTTLLHQAAFEGQVPVLEMLLDAGAEIEARDDRGRTALHLAAICDFRISCDDCPPVDRIPGSVRWGAAPAIEFLVGHGADIQARALDGTTVLDTVPTPCSLHTGACDPDRVVNDPWPSGMCQQTYFTVKRALGASR